LLTAVAMLVYPGGTVTDKTTVGYSFFQNFFSDLGRTVTRAGAPNTIAMVLFATAMTLAGGGLAAFFVAFTQFFSNPLSSKILSWLAALFGVACGVCFIGVGWAPANLNLTLHSDFTRFAFYLFPIAAILAAIAILRKPSYPKRYALVFGLFALLLIAYIILLVAGPSPRTPEGMVIQATGQKLIAYASIISILIEALGAQRVAQARMGSLH
jgi:hypothetical membrane protein